MARKGWDALSDNYRARLIRSGVSESDYRSGTPLHGARGHKNADRESFNKRTSHFASTYTSKRDRDRVRTAVRGMGAKKGSEYMTDVRKMTKLYESGDIEAAKRMWEGRDQSLPAYLFYYHGVFGY